MAAKSVALLRRRAEDGRGFALPPEHVAAWGVQRRRLRRNAGDMPCRPRRRRHGPDNHTMSSVLPLKQPPVGWCVAGTPENIGKK